MSRCTALAPQTNPILKPLPLARWAALLVLFLIEVWVVTYQLRWGRMLTQPDSLWVRIAEQVPALMQILIVAMAATVVFGWRAFRSEFREHSETAGPMPFAWPFFLLHTTFLAAYLALTAWLLEDETSNLGWITTWALSGIAAFACLALTALPAATWLQLARRGWLACLAGAIVGALAFCIGQFTISWWRPLSDATFLLVRFLLSLVASDVTCQPSEFVIGTAGYQVEIGPPCSGYEGIGLVWVFLIAYLGLCRRSLRFPQALVLVPIGTVFIWLTNGLRITALILIGAHWSGDIAERGFHSQAGWLAFNAVCLGMVAVSTRWGFIRRDETDSQGDRVNPVAPYLAPFVVLMAAMMVCAAFSAGFDYLYPLRFFAVAAALLWFWRDYARWSWSWSWPAVGVGFAVFGMWLLLEWALKGISGDPAITAGLEAMSPALAVAWICFRVLGSVVTVPLAEELAFRGFLIRRLQKADFLSVPPGSFTWLSFALSSLLFGLLHDRWLAGTAAGAAYAWILYRRGELSDAVLAHATTNALIAAYVLSCGAWSLWA